MDTLQGNAKKKGSVVLLLVSVPNTLLLLVPECLAWMLTCFSSFFWLVFIGTLEDHAQDLVLIREEDPIEEAETKVAAEEDQKVDQEIVVALEVL